MIKESFGKPTRRSEQETIINYDHEEKKWHIYTDVTPHITRWFSSISPSEIVYHEDDHSRVVSVKGTIEGSVSVRKPVSPERRKQMSELAKERFGK